MRETDFQKEMNRLVEQFGKNSYSPARLQLLWQEVHEFEAIWWARTINQLLLTCRQAPLYPEFADFISRERERQYQFQKKEHQQDAKDFYTGTYQPDDVRTICQTIIQRLQGKISDENYQKFVGTLAEAAKMKKVGS